MANREHRSQRELDIDRKMIADTVEQVISVEGSLRAAARNLGIAPSTLCDLRMGRREPGPCLAERLGIRKVSQWIRRR